jgi:hypothetical protein
MPTQQKAPETARVQPVEQAARSAEGADDLVMSLPGDLVHPSAVASQAPYIPADAVSREALGVEPGKESPTASLRRILAAGSDIDDESTLMAAWYYQVLTTNTEITSRLGTNTLSVPNIFRYIAEGTAEPPYIVFNLAGGPGDSLTSDHRKVLTEYLWNFNLVTLGGDDTIIGPILRQMYLSLHRKGADDFLGGRIIDCWRNTTNNPPPEVSKDLVYVYTVVQFGIQATIPDP